MGPRETDRRPARRVLLRAAALALGVAVLLAGCARAPGRPVPRKTHLAVLPESWREGSIAFTDAGDAYAVVVTTAAGERVVGSEGEGALHERCGRPLFAPATRRLFYWALEHVEGEEQILLAADGAIVPMRFSAQGALELSADGARWAAVAPGLAGDGDGDAGALRVLVDGVEQGRFPDVSRPSFSRDGRHVAYLVENDAGVIASVVDGVERRSFAAPAAPCAVAARRAAPHPDLAAHHAIRFLADGRLLAVTRDLDGWGIYRDDVRLAAYPRSTSDAADRECGGGPVLLVESVRTAAEAPVAIWWERLDGEAVRWRVMRDGRPLDAVICDDFWRAQPPEVGPDGAEVAYVCPVDLPSGERDVYVVQGGVRHGPYREVWGVALSEDGRHVAYGASDGADNRPWSLYVDGVRRGGPYEAVWRPRLGIGATRLAWQAQLERDARGVLGLDGWRLGAFDEVVWGPIFEREERVAWIIRRGRRLTRVEVPLAGLPRGLP